MATLADTIRVSGQGAKLRVVFAYEDGPLVGATGIDSSEVLDVVTDSDGAFSIQLSAGVWVARWRADTIFNEIRFTVPEGSGTYTFQELQDAYTGGDAVTIYYGTRGDTELTGLTLNLLESSVTSNTIARTYPFLAGGYKFLAIPSSLDAPTASSGIRDADTGFGIAMAGVDEGYTISVNGWYCQEVAFNSLVYRVFRSANEIGAEINIALT